MPGKDEHNEQMRGYYVKENGRGKWDAGHGTENGQKTAPPTCVERQNCSHLGVENFCYLPRQITEVATDFEGVLGSENFCYLPRQNFLFMTSFGGGLIKVLPRQNFLFMTAFGGLERLLKRS